MRTWVGDLLRGPCSNTDERRGNSDQDGSSGGMTADMRKRRVEVMIKFLVRGLLSL